MFYLTSLKEEATGVISQKSQFTTSNVYRADIWDIWGIWDIWDLSDKPQRSRFSSNFSKPVLQSYLRGQLNRELTFENFLTTRGDVQKPRRGRRSRGSAPFCSWSPGLTNKPKSQVLRNPNLQTPNPKPCALVFLDSQSNRETSNLKSSWIIGCNNEDGGGNLKFEVLVNHLLRPDVEMVHVVIIDSESMI